MVARAGERGLLFPCSLTPEAEAGGRAGPEVLRAGELACPHQLQHSGEWPVHLPGNIIKLALEGQVWETHP